MRPSGALVLAVALAAAPASAGPRRLDVEGLGRLPAFSHAAEAGGLVFVSGTLGTRADSLEMVPGGIGPQTTQALRNVEAILAGVGAGRDDVARCTVFLADMADYAEMNRAWIAFFGDPPPARATVAVAGLALGARLEVECVAQRPGTGTSAAGGQGVDPDLRYASGFVSSEGERIYWEAAGRGDTVVLCHGLGGNHAVWFQQLPALAEGHRVVTWDQRGFGRSSDAAGEAGPEAAARDLAALLDDLGVARAHLVGQSMGGWAALGFALAHPERVASLVLADTPGGLWTPALEAHFDALVSRGAAGADPETGAPAFRHPALHPSLARRDPARAFLYRQLTSLGPPPPAGLAARLRATSHPPASAAALGAPVLFVAGADDPIFPPARLREVAALLPGARLVEIPGAGHSPYFERPEAWNAAVLDFLAGVAAAAPPRDGEPSSRRTP